jgi:hypothetical protein
MKSKRSALRYRCNNQLITVKAAYQDGEARLIDISTDGCAFCESTVAVEIDERVLVSILVGDAYTFEARAIVVRKDENCTAVQFDLVEPESQNELRRHFSKTLRQRG